MALHCTCNVCVAVVMGPIRKVGMICFCIMSFERWIILVFHVIAKRYLEAGKLAISGGGEK